MLLTKRDTTHLSGGVSLSFEATQSIDDDDDGIDRELVVTAAPRSPIHRELRLGKFGVKEANQME